MSSPDPEGMFLLAKVIAAGAAIGVPIWGLLKLWDQKADKEEVNVKLQEIRQESDIHIAKIFDKFEEHARRDEETHRDILQQMNTNHSELLCELSHKEDRR